MLHPTKRAPALSAATLLALLCLTPHSADAGGWTQPEGSYYVKAGYRVVPGIPTPGGFDATGEVIDLGNYSDHALQVYGEYGVTDTLTMILTATPLGYASYEEESSLFTGSIYVGARQAFTKGKLRTSGEVLIGGTPPLGAEDLALDPGVVWQPSVPTFSASGALQAGYGFGKNWVTADIGYRWNSGLADKIIGGVQIGRQWDHLVLDLHIPWGWSRTTLEGPLNYMGSGDTQYVGLGIGAGWWINEHVGIMTGLESVVTARANAASLTLPIFIQLR